MSKQPRDDANAPIPVLGLRPKSGQQIAISGTAALSGAFHPSTRVITVYTTQDCFIELGNAATVANTVNSHIIPSSFVFDLALSPDLVQTGETRYLSVVGSSGGTLYVSERQ
jgi:hypothetical protein